MISSPELLPPDPLQRPIEELRLSNRAYNALKRVGINRIAELSEKTPNDLRAIKNLGTKTLAEIETKFKEYIEGHPAATSKRPEQSVESDTSPVDAPLNSNLSQNDLSRIPRMILQDALTCLQWTPMQWGDYIEFLRTKRGSSRGNYSSFRHNKASLGNEEILLALPVRTLNALSKAGIDNIESLRTVTVADIAAIHQIGKESVVTIFDLLQSQLRRLSPESQAKLVGEAEPDERRRVKSELGALSEHTRWSKLLQILINEVQAGRLHPSLKLNELAISDWFERDVADLDEPYMHELCDFLENKLRFASVDEELTDLLQWLGPRQESILVQRLSYPVKTLQEIADGFGLTRERVRQLEKRACKIVSRWLRRFSPWRLRTALLLAEDLEDQISLARWESDLIKKGLLGKNSTLSLCSDAFRGTSLDMMLIMLKANEQAETSTRAFGMPANLVKAVEYRGLAFDEIQALQRLSKKELKAIRRQCLNAGAVSAILLSRQLRRPAAAIAKALRVLGYISLNEEWLTFAPRRRTRLSPHYFAFQVNIVKMLSICGPLTLDSVRQGLQNHISRFGFAIAPTSILAKLLSIYRFRTDNENRLIPAKDWNIVPSSSEKTILDLIRKRGPVVNFQELSEEFGKKGLSQPALSVTLRYSVLFQRVDSGLYALRGVAITSAVPTIKRVNKNLYTSGSP